MDKARWLYERIGQLTCFAIGPVMIANALDGYDEEVTQVLAGIAILFAGLILRGQMIHKNK